MAANSRNIHIQHSRHHFTSSNCIFMQLQGTVFIPLQGNEILVNFQGNILIQRTYFFYKNIYSFKEILFVQGIIFISRKLSVHSFKELSSFKENIFQEIIFFQGNYIHSNSRKYVHSRKLYSFINVAFVDIAEIFIQQVPPATY